MSVGKRAHAFTIGQTMDAHAVKVLDGRLILPFKSVCDLIGILFYLVMFCCASQLIVVLINCVSGREVKVFQTFNSN